MDDRFTARPLASWFWIAAIASLLFMAFGCWAYLMHVTVNPATLPLDQREAYAAEPAWVTGANAVAVWVGVLGTLMLLMRRKLAETLLLVSFFAVVVWLGGLLLVPQLRDALSTNDVAVAIVVTLLTGTIWSFARHSRQRGWLR